MGKIQVIEHELTGNAPIKELEIGAAEAGKIITLIRGSMYSNKWGSFIREVISNAYDANKDSGYTGPVEIELPSLLTSELVIRDYGPGMGPWFMDNCYTKVGFSTKENNNNQVGAFGLGRLTPLLISDHYKIETNVDGVKYIYTMAIGQKDGLVKEYKDKTKEPNGTTIRVPCEVRDIKNIKAALEEWCKYMEPLPLVDGQPLNVNDPRKPYPGFEGREYWYTPHSNQMIALNDWVPYEVSRENIPKEWQKNGSMGGAVIKFQPGELNITAPREALEYTEQTINALNKKAEEIINSLKTEAQGHVNTAKTLKEALNMYWDYPTPIRANLTWKNFKLASVHLTAENVGAAQYKLRNGETLMCKKIKVYEDLIVHKHVYIDDGVKKQKERIKYYLYPLNNDIKVYVVPESAVNNPIVREMNWPPLSSIPEPPKVETPKEAKLNSTGQSIKTNKKQIKAYQWEIYNTRTASNLLKYTKEVTLPTDTPSGVCLIIKNGSITKGFRVSLPNRENINDLLYYLNLNDNDLYLIPESNFQLLQGEWKLLDEVVLEKLGDKLKHYQEMFENRTYLAHRTSHTGKVSNHEGINYLSRIAEHIQKLEKERKGISSSGLFYEYLQESLRVKTHLEQEYQAIWAANLIKPVLLTSQENTKLKRLFHQVLKQYPLLENLNLGGVGAERVVNYIKGIDLLTKENK